MKRAFSSLIGRSLLLALAFGGAALVAPGVAAANPACGATVKHNVKLTGDMDCSLYAGDGIVIGKPGITINLNGHALTGPSGSYDGIDNEGYDKVTVENGTVKNYEYGVFYEYTTGAKIEHVKSVGASEGGINLWYSQNGSIDHATASGGGDVGLYLYENTHVNVSNSKAVNNADYGVYDEYSLATLDHVTSNGATNSSYGYGFYIEEPIWLGADYYTIENSTANNNAGSGFYIYDNYPTIYYQAILLDNTADSNTTYGFYATVKTKGKGNHATGNGTLNCWHVPCG